MPVVASTAVAVALLLGGAVGFGATTQTRTVVIFRDEASPPVLFAAQEIRKALQENSYTVSEKPLAAFRGGDPPGGSAIVLNVLPSTASAARRKPGGPPERLQPQAFSVRNMPELSETKVYMVGGGDAVGAMYGGLEFAEMIRLGKTLDSVQSLRRKPAILRRGIKFNIPLDARTPSYDDTGDAAQSNIGEMWNFDFWREFLDEMARDRYNVLTLWNPHPFPSLVKLPDYPDIALADVCGTTLKPSYEAGSWREPMFVSPRVLQDLEVIKKMTMDEKIAFWRRVMQYARDRGIDVYLVTWNVIVNSAEGKYGISTAQDNRKTIAYMRECVRECILTYPLLAGIGIAAGENMKDRKDEFSREKWLWNTYGLGILDAKKKRPDRIVRFIHRDWQTAVKEIMDDFGSKYPDPFELEFKYARAHLYSSPKPPFAQSLRKETEPYGLKCWWNLRNDDIFNFRWGDPDYVREFLTNLPAANQTAGYYVGSDGYVWGREFTSLEPETPRQLEIKKHWYSFLLWGRLGYSPELDRRFFQNVLASHFPEASKTALYDAWSTASKIIPLVNRFHWCDWDFMWAVEGCMDQRKGFHTVEDFIKTKPMEGSGILSIPEFVNRTVKNEATIGITPIQVAEELQKYAQSSLKAVAEIRREVPKMSKELRLTLGDIEAMAYLGNYYASKIGGAVELYAFEQTGDPPNKQAAVQYLLDAVRAWQSYATTAAKQYRPQLLARTRELDGMKTLEDVKKDVESARGAAAKAR